MVVCGHVDWPHVVEDLVTQQARDNCEYGLVDFEDIGVLLIIQQP